MLVSLCVIAYNEEKALPRLLDDIRLQDYPMGISRSFLWTTYPLTAQRP